MYPFYNWLGEIAFPTETFPVSPWSPGALEPGVHLDEYHDIHLARDRGCIY